MIELQNATPERAKSFDCSRCPTKTQVSRRCREDREDFTSEDAAFFPMYIEKGGNLYSYCPGKATWNPNHYALYQALVISAETGKMLEDGPISEQPDWWIDLLSWFIPYYSDQRFYARARAILGDENSNKASSSLARGKR